MQTTKRGYKFRIYPDKEQKEFFSKAFGCNRFVWNYFLNERKQSYLKSKSENIKKRGLNFFDNVVSLTKLKKEKDYIWLNEVNSQSLQQELKNLDASYLRFYKKKSSFPRFKAKSGEQSFGMPQRFSLKDGLLFVPKIKTGIKIVLSRNFGLDARILNITIIKTTTNKYYASFCVEEKHIEKPKLKKSIGIDVGLINFVTLSDGESIKNPKIAFKYRKKLAYLHRQFSKKKKDSRNKEKSRVKLARCYEKITNIKEDFTHKLTRKIVNENQVIAVEDLSVTKMVKNRRLARSISEVSWSKFLKQLKYKSEWDGRSFVKIEKFYPSSKCCGCCGYINQELKLDERKWTCPNCGSVLNRDINAAKNILAQGLSILNSGGGLPSEDNQKFGEAFAKSAVNDSKCRVCEPNKALSIN